MIWLLLTGCVQGPPRPQAEVCFDAVAADDATSIAGGFVDGVLLPLNLVRSMAEPTKYGLYSRCRNGLQYTQCYDWGFTFGVYYVLVHVAGPIFAPAGLQERRKRRRKSTPPDSTQEA